MLTSPRNGYLRSPRSAHVSLPFLDRRQAGRILANRLQHLASKEPVVLALPRGGVPVAAEVAVALQAPLDLLFVRKIGVPHQPELALAAVVEGDPPQLIMDEPVQAVLRVSPASIDAAMQTELAEIKRRRAVYLHGRPPLPISGRTVVVVDDGIATGTTMRAALAALRKRGAARIVLAVPVAPREVAQELSQQVDELICLAQPEPFHAIGMHYEDFHQVPDSEVLNLLDAAEIGLAKHKQIVGG